MNADDPETIGLGEAITRHTAAMTPLEVIYFGGGRPGQRRTITPLRTCESHGRSYLVGLCHQSGTEKSFRLDRMYLPTAPLADGRNDFRAIAESLGGPQLLEGMLAQIAALGNLPEERALAAHLDAHREIGTFFDEYPYGGYTLELKFTASILYLSLGYEVNDCELIHYEFTPGAAPRLSPNIATHYALLTAAARQPRNISAV